MKFCKKCQSDTERYAHGNCKPCARARLLVWRVANPDKVKASAAAWHAANPEYLKEYRQSPKRKAAAAAYYAANSDKLKAASVLWRALNPEKFKTQIADWNNANPEARRVLNNNRRARQIAVGGQLSQGLALKLFAWQRGKCACCGLALGKNYHLDHIMPLALNGSNTDDNMQLLTQRCNNQKHAKHPVDFMQSRGFLL